MPDSHAGLFTIFSDWTVTKKTITEMTWYGKGVEMPVEHPFLLIPAYLDDEKPVDGLIDGRSVSQRNIRSGHQVMTRRTRRFFERVPDNFCRVVFTSRSGFR